jgi:hypothetical protein
MFSERAQGLFQKSTNVLGLLAMIHKFSNLVSGVLLIFVLEPEGAGAAKQDFIIPNICWGLFGDLGFLYFRGGIYWSKQSEMFPAQNVFRLRCLFRFSLSDLISGPVPFVSVFAPFDIVGGSLVCDRKGAIRSRPSSSYETPRFP